MLKQPYYYNGAIKKIITVFGTLFNDIEVAKEGGDSQIHELMRVPIAYGPRAKFLERVNEQPTGDESKVAIKLPRMSFEMTGLSIDTSAMLNKHNFTRCSVQGKPSLAVRTRQAVPYNMTLQLNILAKNQSDALQIVEQILPVFNPSYTVSVKGMENPSSVSDIPFTLSSVSIQDDYEGDFANTRRTIIYTLDFTVPVYFYGASGTHSVISSSEGHFYNSLVSPPIQVASVVVSNTVDATPTNPDSFVEITETFGF